MPLRVKRLLISIASLSLIIGIFSPIPNAFAATITTPSFSTVTGNTSVVLTLSGGSCALKAAPLAATDFTFGGTNSAALAAGTFTRTSATVVTITGLTLATTSTNTISVLTATQATACTSATAAAVPIAITSPVYTTLAGGTSVRVNLTSGTYRSGTFSAADFVFGGTNAAALALGTFTLTSSTRVTITGITLAAAADNTVQVIGSAQATQATSVSGSVRAYNSVTSPTFSNLVGGTSVTVTLSGGTYATGIITASNFAFTGSNSSALAAGIFTRTSNTVVTITNLTLVAAANDTVQVLAPTEASQATSVAAAAVPYKVITSPAFSAAVGSTSLTITLAGGTFKTGTIAATDFAFAGTDSTRLALGTFTLTSPTVVTITGLTSMLLGSDNTVQVLGATQSSQASSVVGAAPIHSVTYNLGGGTGTLPTQTPVSEGSSFLTSSSSGLTKTGYTFSNWSDGTTGYAGGSSYTLALSNVTLTATWTINSYSITYISGANGSITGTTPQTVSYLSSGSAVTATPATGYHFVSWSDGILTATRSESAVAANISPSPLTLLSIATALPISLAPMVRSPECLPRA